MQTRKIALHRNSLIAIVMTLLVLGSALAIAGNSSAINPQEGTVTYHAFYLSPSKLPATGAKVTVSTLSGYQVKTFNGASNQVNLSYGSYIFTMQPYATYGSSYIVNGTSTMVNVTSSTSVVNLSSTAYATHDVTVSVPGAKSGAPATVSFSTENGFVFETNTTTGTFNATLPSGGFFATVDFGGQINTTYESSVGYTLTLNTSSANVEGGIVTNRNGQNINNFNVIAISKSAPYSHSVMPFTNANGAFTFVDQSANYNYVISANGYNPVQYSQGQSIYTLSKASSSVNYNYSLGNNPGYLNLTVTYAIGNSTALPFMPNSTIGSFYWQYEADQLASKTSYISSYLEGLVGNYSNYAILVNGHNYKLTGKQPPATVTVSTKGMNANVSFQFQNFNVTASSVANGFSVQLFAQGTQYTSGALYYNNTFNYNISELSLASPVSAADTFVSPVKLMPQANSGFLTLKFNKVSKPVVTASQINLFWNNSTPRNYLVASNSTSAVFIAPTNTQVSFNLSNAFYNPVTNTNDYSKALNYTWKLNGTVLTHDYNHANATIKLGGFGNYSVTVKYTSASGGNNTTTFNVFAYNATPSAYLNVTTGGKTLFATAAVPNSQTVSVPQAKPIQFSGYYSKLSIPGTSYTVPLLYNWYFPGYTNTAVNVSQTFNTPYVASKTMVSGYLNVSTAVGKVASTNLLLNVTDTTAPSGQITLQNATHATISQPVAGQVTIFSANKSTDKYYVSSDLSYNWSIVYANGTKVPSGNSTYQLVGNDTNLSYLGVQFNTLNSLIVSLKVTNPSNVSSYTNFTTSMVVVSPRLVVDSVYFPTTPAQGSKTLMYVNVSNNGTVDASSFYIVAIINGHVVNNQSYGPLPVGTTKQFEFNLTSTSQGNVQVQFEALNSTQPSFFAKSGSLTLTQKVSPPAYQTPLIVGGVILIIIVIGAVYYRLSSRGTSKPREKKQAPPAKKTDEKKK